MKKRTKILAMVMAVVTLMSVICAQAFAATTPVTDEYIVTENGVTKVYDPITGDLWYDTVNGRTDAFQEYSDNLPGCLHNTDPDWDEWLIREPAWTAIVRLENKMPIITNPRPSGGFGTFGSSNDDFYNPDGIEFTNADPERMAKAYYSEGSVEYRNTTDKYAIKKGARYEPYMYGIIGDDNVFDRNRKYNSCFFASGADREEKLRTNLCDGVTFELKDGVLTIKGDGKTKTAGVPVNYASLVEPWSANKHVKVVVIDGEMPEMHTRFANMNNLETVIIMNNNTNIVTPLMAFRDCPKLKTIIWGADLKDSKLIPEWNLGDNPAYKVERKDETATMDERISQMNTAVYLDGMSTTETIVAGTNRVALTSYYGDWDARVAKAKQYIAEADLPAEVLALLPAELGGTAGKAGTTPETKPAPDQGQSEVITDTMRDKTISDWARGQVADAEGWNLIPFQALGTNYKNAITRGQFCALATRLCEELNGEELPYDTDVFTDVDNTNTDILKMYKAGIIGGYGNGKFGPNDPLTREQAATILARLSSVMGTELSITKTNSFTDKFNTWAVEPVAKCFSAGIMGGYNATTFGAKDKYTIEQSIISMLRTHLHILDDRGEIGA